MIGDIARTGLPADPEAERWVLGLALRRPDVNLPTLAGIVDASQFSASSNGLIWLTLIEMRDAGDHIDLGTLARELHKRGQLADVGGVSYLSQLTDGMPDLANGEVYAGIVRECAVRRRAAIGLYAAAENLCQPGADVSAIDRAHQVIQAISAESADCTGLVSARDIIGADGFMDPHLTEPGIPTPWGTLNQITGGFRAGQLVIIAARPAVGKSTMAAQMAVAAAETGVGATIFSLEMSSPLIMRRLIAGRSSVNLSKWNQNALDRSERDRVAYEASRMAELPLYLHDLANTTIASIRAELLKARATKLIDLVVVDYLQLVGSVRGRSSATRNDEVGDISRGLKVLAMELQVPIVALSQLSRAGERDGRRPRLSDLRDSGSIEQDADIVAFLHRNNQDGHSDLLDLIVAKNRIGRTGDVPLLFNATRAEFVEADPAYG